MLGPSKSAPDYEKQMAKYKKDNSEWGLDSAKVDIMKSPLNQTQGLGPSVVARTAQEQK